MLYPKTELTAAINLAGIELELTFPIPMADKDVRYSTLARKKEILK